MKNVLSNIETGLALVVDHTASKEKAVEWRSCRRRREDRVIKRELFPEITLYGPNPKRLPWEFLRVA